jgi:hypothetical protein
VSVYFTEVAHLSSLHRIDRTIVASLYSHRKGPQDVPTLSSVSRGQLNRFFANELQKIRAQSCLTPVSDAVHAATRASADDVVAGPSAAD